MSGNYNTWGGKNNSWGNKNRKDKSSNTSGDDNRQEPNKLGRALFGGVTLFFCAALGISIVEAAYTDITDAIGKAEIVKDVKELVTGEQKIEYGEKEFNIMDEIDLDAGDVKDILEYITKNMNEGTTMGENVVIVEYSSLDNVKKYEKNIIKKLDKFNKDVTFIAISEDYFESTDDATVEMERVQKIAFDNISLIHDTPFKQIQVGGCVNRPEPGNLMIAITFLK